MVGDDITTIKDTIKLIYSLCKLNDFDYVLLTEAELRLVIQLYSTHYNHPYVYHGTSYQKGIPLEYLYDLPIKVLYLKDYFGEEFDKGDKFVMENYS